MTPYMDCNTIIYNVYCLILMLWKIQSVCNNMYVHNIFLMFFKERNRTTVKTNGRKYLPNVKKNHRRLCSSIEDTKRQTPEWET